MGNRAGNQGANDIGPQLLLRHAELSLRTDADHDRRLDHPVLESLHLLICHVRSSSSRGRSYGTSSPRITFVDRGASMPTVTRFHEMRVNVILMSSPINSVVPAFRLKTSIGFPSVKNVRSCVAAKFAVWCKTSSGTLTPSAV